MTDSLPPEGKHPDVIDAEAPPAKPGKYVSDAKVQCKAFGGVDVYINDDDRFDWS